MHRWKRSELIFLDCENFAISFLGNCDFFVTISGCALRNGLPNVPPGLLKQEEARKRGIEHDCLREWPQEPKYAFFFYSYHHYAPLSRSSFFFLLSFSISYRSFFFFLHCYPSSQQDFPPLSFFYNLDMTCLAPPSEKSIHNKYAPLLF